MASTPQQETAALLGRVQASQLPSPIRSAALNPDFIHNGRERAEAWGLGSTWLLWKRRLVLPPILTPPTPSP